MLIRFRQDLVGCKGHERVSARLLVMGAGTRGRWRRHHSHPQGRADFVGQLNERNDMLVVCKWPNPDFSYMRRFDSSVILGAYF